MNFKNIAAVVGLVAILGLGAFAYSIFRTPAEASRPIEAIPLAASDTATPATRETSQPTASPATTAAPTEETVETTATAEPTQTEAATATAATSAATATASTPTVFEIVQEESEARFVIDEVLNGAPKTVVGTTDQVAGELAVNASDVAASRVGVIQINARTLTTDSDFRNRAIKNDILNTDQYEFITFTPTEITGLPESGSVGQTYTFQITGDLTIRDVTQQVTFDATVTPSSETRLEGTAQATIRYADFGITIPQVRQVASVSDDVRLEIDFVAVPK